MDEFPSSLLLPRSSTALDMLISENSAASSSSLAFKTSLDSSGSLGGCQSNLQKAIESLNLAAISPVSSPWRSTSGDVATDSDYRSLSGKFSEIGFGGSEASDEEHPERFTGSNEQLSAFSSTDDGANDTAELASLEPEADILEQFRHFGVRFIRDPDEYTGCDCAIPHQLLEWAALVTEVAVTARGGTHIIDPLPLCFHHRWAEIRQNFHVDIFGDLQFQDFLLAREQRGFYQAMVHFAGVFANVGYDGSYWYWVVLGEGETPFIESRHRKKGTFVASLRTMVREQFRLNRDSVAICPEPMTNAHLYVRADEIEFEREPNYANAMPKINVEEWIVDRDDMPRPLEDPEDDPFKKGALRMINGRRAPRELSYLQLYNDSFNSLLAAM